MPPRSLTHQVFAVHQAGGSLTPGDPVALTINQTLTQDATGTLVMLELEAMGLDRVRTRRSVQYVDHNLIQQDFKNADDHLFLKSACERFGLVYSRPGNGVSHPLHMQSFGIPGESLLGSDSHSCAAGALGMLAMGAGGLEVALVMAGKPYHVIMPAPIGVRLEGELPPWVSAKDVILELLRRRGVKGALNRTLEYHGPGMATLDVWDRHVIANMGAELGATATLFPSDDQTRRFLAREGRVEAWRELRAEEGVVYDDEEVIELDKLEPLIAKPSSPGNVVPVREVAGEPIYQAYIGSSANPGYRDFAVVAEMMEGETVHPEVSLDINPSTRGILMDLTNHGHLASLLGAGARVHQAGCNGCIGMGQAPASGRNSLRTTPRNFPGRSGTREDAVWLCSPETAAASALHGVITDPRDQGDASPKIPLPERPFRTPKLFVHPPEDLIGQPVELVKGPNIVSLPELDPIPDAIEAEVLLVMGDDISTDEILPAGTEVLPYRSNIPKIAEFAFTRVDQSYPERAKAAKDEGRVHAVIGGSNYGQGSSREHAALAPAYLGLRVVLARDFARIHAQNLVNYGVLPLRLTEDLPRARPSSAEAIDRGHPNRTSSDKTPTTSVMSGASSASTVTVTGIHAALDGDGVPEVRIDGEPVDAALDLSDRQRELLRAGGLINWLRERI